MNQLYRFIFRKSILLPLGFLICYILFHKPAEDFFSKILVNYLFENIDSIWYNDIIFIIIILLALLLTVQRFKQFTFSAILFSFFAVTVIIYCFYRFGQSPWEFKPFSFTENFKYADTLIIVFLTSLFLLTMGQKKYIICQY